jgi:hypothetical protein
MEFTARFLTAGYRGAQDWSGEWAYHATDPDNLDDIRAIGLEATLQDRARVPHGMLNRMPEEAGTKRGHNHYLLYFTLSEDDNQFGDLMLRFPLAAVKKLQHWEEDESRGSMEEYYFYSKLPFKVPPSVIQMKTPTGGWEPIGRPSWSE